MVPDSLPLSPLPFIHLRVHSAYSLAEGAIKIKDLNKLCKEHKMPAIAITDTCNLFGALEFAISASDAGIQPIIGCQLNISAPHLSSAESRHPPSLDQLVLIAKNAAGYQNLMYLATESYLRSPPAAAPHVTFDQLHGYTEGLIALTGGPKGSIGRLLFHDQAAYAEEILEKLKHLFPDHLYIEIMRHGLDIEKKIEPHLIQMAYAHNIPLVATNDVFFSDPSMYEAHDALLCVAEGAYVSQPERRHVTPHHYLKSSAEMTTLFADLPEAVQNTRQIAQRCAFMPRPHAPILPVYPTTSGRTEADELVYMAETGLDHRLHHQVFAPTDDEQTRNKIRTLYRDRLHYEIGIIDKMGFPGYFLIVADFIQWAKSQGIPVGPGRGSGAGSLVAWSLTITDIDPIRFGLIFERFLNPERVSMPDFDVDFCQDRRDEVISYVRKKYGDDRVAHIITFGKLQARAVLRDVGRVLQMPYGQVDKICKLIPNNPASPVTLEQAVAMEPALRDARKSDATVGNLIDMGMKLEGLYRHASTHAAGVVISDRPLHELVPLYKDDKSETPATQFSMKYVELAGLVKFDFLGLKTLTVIQKCCEMIQTRGIIIDISKIPLDDEKTFALLTRVETVGVFQVESAGMRDVLRKLRPDRFEDLIALVALYRPGPMDDIPRYLACKHGEEAVTFLHPELAPILEGTYGVMVYQEQVMKIAQVLGGYTLGAADLLRRAMGKKIKAEMDDQRALFVNGAIQHGVSEDTAVQIFEQMAKFAGYGFNKSHAAPYALLTYQTAYLKANYPLEFYAASMTYDLQNTDKLNVFRQDMVKGNFTLLPPDINHSEAFFTVEGNAVRYALAAVKNVGEAAMQALVAERVKNGPFKDLGDFTARLDHRAINKRQLENLVVSGAFDTLNSNRHQVFLSIDTILRQANLAAQERQSQQASLFGFSAKENITALSLPKALPWGALEQLQKEFDALGFFLSAHPLDIYGDSLARLGISSSQGLAENADGSTLKVAGVLLVKQERTSKTGQKFAFIQVSDSYGVFEVAVFSEVFTRLRDQLIPGVALLITATIRFDGEGFRLTAQSAELLDQAVQSRTQELKFILSEQISIPDIVDLLQSARGGSTKISLEIQLAHSPHVIMTLPGHFHISADLRSRLHHIPGIISIS